MSVELFVGPAVMLLKLISSEILMRAETRLMVKVGRFPNDYRQDESISM